MSASQCICGIDSGLVCLVVHSEDNNPARMSQELNPGGIQSSCGT